MLKQAAPLLSDRLSGWDVISNPAQRPAAGSRTWSLLIAVAAAIVAMAAVAFDIRLPSDTTEPTTVSPAIVSESVEPAVTSQLAAEPATSPPAQSAAQLGTGDTRTQTAVDPTPTTGSRAPQHAPATSVDSAAPLQTTAPSVAAAEATPQSTVEGSSDSASISAGAQAAVADDPASRIRAYVGLNPGAQLPVSFVYIVEAGDTASSIAQRFGLEEATVLFNNFDIYDPNHLTVGQRLQLPSVNGLVYTVQPGDTLSGVLVNFQANLEATLAFPANGISSPEQIYAGQQLLLVHGSASLAAPVGGNGGSISASPAPTWSEPTFVLRLKYSKISDLFGTPRANAVGYHTGVDYVADVGELIGAAAAGVVSVATWDPSYGNWVEIDHGGGYRSRYAHLDVINVQEGQWVGDGDYIGTVGNTGNSSGAHLHFEIIVNGQAVNPLAWLN